MYFAHTDERITETELENLRLSREAAQEGIVMLKNDGTLPLSPCKVALYGAGARRTVKGGCGSGDVNERHVVSIEEGLLDAGFTTVGTEWLDAYDRIVEEDRLIWKRQLVEETARRKTHIDVVYLETHHMLPCGDALVEDELTEADAAIYVVARRSTEGCDRWDVPGDWKLYPDEERNIKLLARHYRHFVLLLDVPGPLGIADVAEDGTVNAIVLVSQGGLEMGHAVADILTGSVNPSGHLSSTWGRAYKDYPFTQTFGRDGGIDVTYDEGIHVGYRWFDRTMASPLYPFGYGLSYTSFAVSSARLTWNDEGVNISVSVTNVGNVPGKEVIQIYCSQPEGLIEKCAKVLIGFGKTKTLAPDETEEVTAGVTWRDLASYDAREKAWVLEGGSYTFLCGRSSVDTMRIGIVEVGKRRVMGRCGENAAAPHPSPKACEIVSGLTLDQRLSLVTGAAPSGQTGVIGNAAMSVVGGAGETSHDVPGLPSVVMADGGSGIRLVPHFVVDAGGELVPPDHMAALERGAFADAPAEEVEGTDYYQYCTSFPIGTMLAQTWNRDLLREVGRGVAREMREFGIRLWLAPSVNIHRNPLCGRNFEYYSEDPLLAGALASELCLGVQETPGTGVCVKHFACNNQEHLRGSMNSVVDEQTLREVYLRVFEIVVRTAQPAAIMTSYNQVNGMHSANNTWLLSDVARGDWGFGGIFMTDWGTTHHGESDPALCMSAGNDLIMPGRQADRDRIREAIVRGELAVEELDRCAARVVDMVLRLTRA